MRQSDTADHTEAFRAYMEAIGVTPPEHVTPDGAIHRFHMADERRDRKSGWYVYHSNGTYSHGAFGDWRAGETHHWTAINPTDMHPVQRKYFELERKRLDRVRKAEQERRHAQAAKRAWKVWEHAREANIDHEYLLDKGVRPHGIRKTNGQLVIPMLDAKGRMHGLQYIAKNGEKRFLPGSAKRGHFYPLRNPTLDVVIVAEGFATAATLYEATTIPTVCAFDAGNLEPVARAIDVFYRPPRIIIAGDNDRATTGNPGRTAAIKAAKAVGGRYVLPDMGDKSCDFNDLGEEQGLQAVRQAIEAVL